MGKQHYILYPSSDHIYIEAVSQDLSRIFDKTQDRSPILQDLRRIDCDLAFFSSQIWRSFRLRSGLTGMFNCSTEVFRFDAPHRLTSAGASSAAFVPNSDAVEHTPTVSPVISIESDSDVLEVHGHTGAVPPDKALSDTFSILPAQHEVSYVQTINVEGIP
eukprot:scaffold13710_cov122-Isochrysis_galbana.AAC.5